MRSHYRTVAVLALAVALVTLFLRNVDLGEVFHAIAGAKPLWLLVVLATIFGNMVIRTWRWQYLLEPLGGSSFRNSFRANVVGFAARSVLPVAAGELVRPYFLSRHERVSATGAFATVVIERLLDLVTVLILLASYVFLFDQDGGSTNPAAWRALKWSGGAAGVASIAALVALFVLAGHPFRFGRALARLERIAPASAAGLLAGIAEKFAVGLGAIRQPRRLVVALAWSLPLWLCIALGIWSAAVAFGLTMPFAGSFLLIALLTVGITVPTPGGVGGFHEAFRLGTTMFFGAPNDTAVAAAIVLHAITIGPVLVVGLVFAAQDGLSVSAMRHLAEQPDPEPLV